MSTKTTVALEDYLQTSYEGPDPEFIAGEVVERTMPTWLHGRTVYLLGLMFARQGVTGLFVAVETRLRLRPDLVRIPDLCVYQAPAPREPFPSHPPLVAVEVLSPDDLFSGIRTKFDEYAAWGVKHIWLIDPEARKALVYEDGGLRRVETLEIPEHGVGFRVRELFD